MRWHEFIFSNQPRQLWLRHGIFWLVWWWYFFVTTYYLRSPHNQSSRWDIDPWEWNNADFIVSLWMVLLHIAACYIVIWLLLPQYLLKAKYFKFILAILLLALAMVEISHFIYGIIFPMGNTSFIPFSKATQNSTWWPSIMTGPLNAVKIIAVAVAIKLLKRWWLKQKESRQLEREKISAELQLLKAQIHPGFLFNTLNNIYAYALAGSPRASEMLIKLSDLLSYMLYECDQSMVSLKKEIEMMKEYMLLEKIRMGDNLEMEILVKGNTENKFIAPFLLLPFIENSLKHCAVIQEKCWVSLEIKVEENFYLVKLINGILPELIHHPGLYGNGLSNVQKRLSLLYPNRYELKMNAEEEVFLVNLKIQSNELPTLNEINSDEITDLETRLHVTQ